VIRDLKTILADLQEGRGPRVLLLFGDDLRVAEARGAIVDRLVPVEQRGFNLERFDGRAASWEQIETSLMTPPFLPGKKLLWVDGATYFYAREQSGELTEKLWQLWREAKRDEAARVLLDLLVVEGWTQERWDSLDGPEPLFRLLRAESSDEQDIVAALLSHCKGRAMEFAKRKGAEAHRLGAVLAEGLPEWSFLLLTAAQVDRRTKLFKHFEELGAVLPLVLDRDKSGRISRDHLLEFVGRELGKAGKKLDPEAREMILARAGDDLRGLRQELEKLLLFVGDRATIRAGDVASLFADQGEGWIFDLTRALGERDAVATLSQLGRLMAQGDHPLKILATVAAEARRLLAARELLSGELGKIWRRGMSYTQFQQAAAKHGLAAGGRNLYGDFMCLQRADRFSHGELRAFMERVFDADLRLRSSATNGRLVLEKLFLDMCLGAPKRPGYQRTRA
jgi:DNA polymerase-3 subunit delta